MKKQSKKFKSIEKNAQNVPDGSKEILWEGEEVGVESETKLESDLGTGQAIVIRFFEFGANPETFRQQRPTAQMLFNSHRNGIESLLWRDGLKPVEGIDPRLIFSKDKSHYKFVVTCTTSQALIDETQTLSQLLKPNPIK